MTLFDDVHRLQEKCKTLESEKDALEKRVDRLDEQVNGQRGISAAITTVLTEVGALRKGMYYVAGLIMAACITFAFSVLVFFA